MTRLKHKLMNLLLGASILAAASGAQSCAVMRAFSLENKDSRISADSLAAEFKPEGKLLEMEYECSVGGASRRRMIVYLPKSYNLPENASRRYPVLYLLHGARGNESSWCTNASITSIADELWDENLAAECIIVMPNMNQYDNDEQGETSMFKKPFESLFDMDGSTDSGFIHDVVEFTDRNFRTLASKQYRGIAGLSIGAMQALYISANFPDSFSEIGLFSPLYKNYITHSEHSDIYNNLVQKQKIQFQDPPRTYNIYIGNYDFFIDHMYWYRQYLYVNGFHYKFIRTGGGHDWRNWKSYIRMFMQEIFPDCNQASIGE